MEVSWYCWVTVMSLVTNFHGYLCWPTLQPSLNPVTSKHELDSDESRKVLGSSVVTSVSVIMGHSNGTKTFLSDGIENPELKTNAIGSPGNLLNPDRYEFYTFDETGDLVKRLMTWDEIQGLIAGGDGDSLLGEASVPMYYSDSLSDKVGETQLTANDFQTSDGQDVHKVVESVQNVLKSELAASQSRIPPVIKPGLLASAPNWSLFLPTLLDNAEDGSELSNLGLLASSPASTTESPVVGSTSQSITAQIVNTTGAPKITPEISSTTTKEYVKKTENPIRFKVTTSKPSIPVKSTFNPPTKPPFQSTTKQAWSSTPPNPFLAKKPFSTSKYGGYSPVMDERWSSTYPTTKKNFTPIKYGSYSTSEDPITSSMSTSTKKIFTSSKYGGYATSDDLFSTRVPQFQVRRNSTTTKYGGYSSITETISTEPTPTKRTTTPKYTSQSTNNELFASIASVLNQVSDNTKVTNSFQLLNNATDKPMKVSTESSGGEHSTPDRIISMSQFKNTAEPSSKLTTTDGYKSAAMLSHRPTTESSQTTEAFKTASTEKKFFISQEYTRPQMTHKFTSSSSLPQSTTEVYKFSTENLKIASSDSHRISPSPFSSSHKTTSSVNSHKTVSPMGSIFDPHQTASAESHRIVSSTTASSLFDTHQSSSPFSHKTASPTPSTFNTYQSTSPYSHKTASPIASIFNTYQTASPYSHKTASPLASIFNTHQTASPYSHKTASPLASIFNTHQTASPYSHKTASSIASIFNTHQTASPYSHKTVSPIASIFNTYQTASPYSHKTVSPVASIFNTYQTASPYSHKTGSPFTSIFNTHQTASSISHRPASIMASTFETRHPPSPSSNSHGTVSISEYKLSTEPTKYTILDTHKTASSIGYPSVDSSTKKPDSYEASNTSRLPEDVYLRNNISDVYSQISSSLYTPVGLSTFKDSSKPTKTYESSTSPSSSYVTLQKQSYTTKPMKNKTTYTKFTTSKPIESTPTSEAHLQSSASTASEKPLIRISTIRSTSSDQTTTNKPEPLVTWISTSPLEEAPNKVSLFGVYDSDKLVTEQYVSSSKDHSPLSIDFFRNSTSTTRNPTTSNEFTSKQTKPSTSRPPSTEYFIPVYHSNLEIESKTEATLQLMKHSTTVNKPTESGEKLKIHDKTTIGPQVSNYSSETVMQRIPTINPPNKLTTAGTGTSTKSSTRPQYTFTETMKNITQIAVMLNRLNESATKTTISKNEYRNKVTHNPIEPTKPLNPSLINDCITSLMLGSLKENTTESATNENSHIHYYKLPASEQKDNSLIYYYKLPPVLSLQDSIKATEATSSPGTQYYKPDMADSAKSTTEKEFMKITTANRPDDLVQEGISAVTNILLQTEGRLPNKEFSEFQSNTTLGINPTIESILLSDGTNTSSKTTESLAQSTPSYKPTNYTIESISDNSTEYEPDTDTEKSWTSSNVTESVITETTTDPIEVATVPATTVLTSDFRTDVDNANSTVEEEQDVKPATYKHSINHTSSNMSQNATDNSAPAYTEVIRMKNSTFSTTTTKPVIKVTTEKVESSTWQNNNNRSIEASSISSTTVEYVEVKLENKTKIENKTEPVDGSPPPSSFRSPSSPAHRLPTSTPGPGVELHPAPNENMGLEASTAYLGDDVKRFVDFCNELSFKIWTTQTGKSLMTSRSIVLSPFAVLSTLAMIFLGARGSSSGIMNDILKLDDMVTFNPHQVFQNITESALNSKNIGVANSAIVREIFTDKAKGKVLDFYKERLQQYYDTHVEEINFNSIGDLVRRRTNLLVKRKTQGKIQDYLKGSALVLKPPLAVLTANIFQTNCELASAEGRDGEMYFVVRPSTRQRRLVPIPAVVYRSGFLAGYEPGLDATAVTLNPESMVSTILVLPGQQGQVAPGDGLARLEQRLLESSYRRGAWSRLLRSLLFRPGLELQMPRFSHKSVLNLTVGMSKMGMDEIFTADKADLRGINGVSNELHLSDMVQVNMFSTCGENTVGARHHTETYPPSPQRVGKMSDIFDRTYLDDSVNNYYSSLPLNLRPRQARLPDNPRLRFDRPFLYIVRHNPTGMILYIGRFNPRLLP